MIPDPAKRYFCRSEGEVPRESDFFFLQKSPPVQPQRRDVVGDFLVGGILGFAAVMGFMLGRFLWTLFSG